MLGAPPMPPMPPIPQMPIPALRAAVSVLTALAVLATASCAPSGGDAELPTPAAAVADRARVFLIALEDGDGDGPSAGCGGSAVPVEVPLPAPQPALEGALRALVALREPVHPASGLYNALHASPLKVVEVSQAAGVVSVELDGYVELAGECDGPRALEQLRLTALQFSDVDRVEIYLHGKPLSRALSGTETDAPAR